MNGLRHVTLMLIGLLAKNLVHCQIGTSYQQNHPNHVLSNMMQNTDPIMAPSIATPQTGKILLQGQFGLIKPGNLPLHAIRECTSNCILIIKS